VAYVDRDELTVHAATELAQQHPRIAAIHGDVRNPGTIMSHPIVTGHLNLDQPTLILLMAVLHFVADDPVPIMHQLRRFVASGSMVAVTHACVPRDMTPEAIAAARTYSQNVAPLTLRTPEQGQALFEQWDLLPPGITGIPFWHPDPTELDGDDLYKATQMPGWIGVALAGNREEPGEPPA
jgi:hypothetical protein